MRGYRKSKKYAENPSIEQLNLFGIEFDPTEFARPIKEAVEPLFEIYDVFGDVEVEVETETEPSIEVEVVQAQEVTASHYIYREEHNLYPTGAKTRFKNNLKAIQLLKELQTANRIPTEEEQIILARYVGWGGLANALTPHKEGWEKEYEQISQLLTPLELKSAQESTLTAYYTEPKLIQMIYDTLKRFGFKGGNILEPSMGTGNFFSVFPFSFEESSLYGVECDTITGQIAQYLYPEAHIQIEKFEETQFSDHFFDLVIGNVPFGDFKVSDSRYDKYHFKIHNYFFAKAIDKARPGGLIALITTKGTMDREDDEVRRYLHEKAKLIGAIRLPNTAFKTIAGTQVTTDLIILQKRTVGELATEEEIQWFDLEHNASQVPYNEYFFKHPDCLLGNMVFDESMYGAETSTACHPFKNLDWMTLCEKALNQFQCQYKEHVMPDQIKASKYINAIDSVKNFTYTLQNGQIYYREHSKMYLQPASGVKFHRLKGMVKINLAVRDLIDYQLKYQNQWIEDEEAYQTTLKQKIHYLNQVYDPFISQYGFLHEKTNRYLFEKDVSLPLLLSLETEDSKQKGLYRKTDIFFKPTIAKSKEPFQAQDADEALKYSLNLKGYMDLPYMSQLLSHFRGEEVSFDSIVEELGDKVYRDPAKTIPNRPQSGWVSADEYLSGNVVEKLREAKMAVIEDDSFKRNVEALEQNQPTPIPASEISFSIGSTWIPLEVYQAFMYETFKTQRYYQDDVIFLEYTSTTSTYYINRKNYEPTSVAVNQTFGTSRINAYEIFEDSLNLKIVEVRDTVEYMEGGERKTKRVLNQSETILAREKQAQMKLAFEKWLFNETERAETLVQIYNDLFNSIVPRIYRGEDLILPDISSTIQLRPHQLNVIAHGIYGTGNLLIAHEVGAGKTFSAIAIGYELKRLGIIHKPLYVVPNHLLNQWSGEYMRLYPNANILVATKRDLVKERRREFISRIATGDFDAIIMAHSSFERINMSIEYQRKRIEQEIDDIQESIIRMKSDGIKGWSLKQIMAFRKRLEFKLSTLVQAKTKDEVIYFEELGVDCLIVDEAHAFKNNNSYTKLQNVAGLSNTQSQRAVDMYYKTLFINELNHGRGVIYLTGTPVSNSMSELHILQKTLQPEELRKRNILGFDCWASTFGIVESSLEIKPEGNGYQMRNRFAKFHNLPELMTLFSTVADIKTSDMLNLPTPNLKTGAPIVIETEITDAQQEIVMEQYERAKQIRNGQVKSKEDNFLKLTQEARFNATDPRYLDPEIPYDPGTKLNVCARKVAEIYHRTTDKRLTQLIFCDKGTPDMKNIDRFNYYTAMKQEMMDHGVAAEEIVFIHEAKTDIQRSVLFEKVNRGEVRVLIGSTEKMGTGMNVQQKLIALHHLDVPWKPSDLIQRNGRILRQGNENEEVEIYNYITKNTFDAYLWQVVEKKQRYISQVMTCRSNLRSCEDIDEVTLQYAQFKAIAVADERVKEKLEIDNEVHKLTLLKSSWNQERFTLHEKVNKTYPSQIKRYQDQSNRIKEDLIFLKDHVYEIPMLVDHNVVLTDKTEMTKLIDECVKALSFRVGSEVVIGNFNGFELTVYQGGEGREFILKHRYSYSTKVGTSIPHYVSRLLALIEKIPTKFKEAQAKLDNYQNQLKLGLEELNSPFPYETRLEELKLKKIKLDSELEFNGIE